MDLVKAKEMEQMRDDIKNFNIGDTVKVHFKIIEGKTERVQVFEGLCIAKKNSGIRKTFTVRKISYGIGVERTFPLHSPKIVNVEITRVGRVRRAKLYYIRNRMGKAAKVKEYIQRKESPKKRKTTQKTKSVKAQTPKETVQQEKTVKTEYKNKVLKTASKAEKGKKTTTKAGTAKKTGKTAVKKQAASKVKKEVRKKK
jgi:large subunit ribosomal protein L19